jgi:thiamine biosynthesis protein ThiS
MVQDTLKLAAMMMMKGNTMMRFNLPLGCRDICQVYDIFSINYSHQHQSPEIRLPDGTGFTAYVQDPALLYCADLWGSGKGESAMKILLNNDHFALEGDSHSVREILAAKGWSFPLIVVKVNGCLVPRSDWDSALVCNGDEMDAMHLVSGG